MTIGTIITGPGHIALSSRERKIPWDEPAFSQRMLENHLSQEHDWDPAAQISSTLFMAIEESGKVTRFGSQMTAWRDEDYLELLRTAGLSAITRPDEAQWPVSETFAGKLYALLAEKMLPILLLHNQ